MRLTVIGGSGGYPGRGRPCSGYFVEAEGFALLIDPGYGVATALSVDDAATFDAVLVSHAHPDHCVDLNPILRGRAWADDPLPALPVPLCRTLSMLTWHSIDRRCWTAHTRCTNSSPRAS